MWIIILHIITIKKNVIKITIINWIDEKVVRLITRQYNQN